MRLLTLLAACVCSSLVLAQSVPVPVPGLPETVGTSASTVDAPPKPAPGAVERVAAPAENLGPITRPLVRAGDEWIYRRVSGSSSTLLRQRVTHIDFDGISLSSELAGSPDTTTAVYSREWGLLGSGYNTYAPALAYYSFPLYPGKRWRIDSAVSNFGAGQTGRIEGEGVALGFEEVETAAGKFMTLKVLATFETGDPGDAAYRVKVRETHWYAREILRTVRVESETQAGSDAPRRETIELVKFKLE